MGGEDVEEVLKDMSKLLGSESIYLFIRIKEGERTNASDIPIVGGTRVKNVHDFGHGMEPL